MLEISGEPVDELVLHVAVEREVGYVLEPALSDVRVDVKGRDLRASPHELTIDEAQLSSPGAVRVLAEGYQGQWRASFGITDPPLAFVEGEVVRGTLVLGANSGGGISIESSGCIEVTDDKQQTWTLGAENDQDCDGSAADGDTPDCDDTDPAVNPFTMEACDGKDTNCDGQRLSPNDPRAMVSCYGLQGYLCREGTRSCNDQTGQMGTCTSTEQDRRVAQAYCDAFKACTGSDPFTCANNAVKPATGSCTIELALTTVCGGRVKLDPPTQASTCRWDLIDSAGFPLGLAEGASDPHKPVVATCSPYLVVASAGAGVKGGKVVLEFFGDAGKPSVVVELMLQGSLVSTCGASPLACSPINAP